MWRSGIFLLLACLTVACIMRGVIAQADNCDDAKAPIFILPGIAGSELQGVYSDRNENPVYTDRGPGAASASAASSNVDSNKPESQVFPAINEALDEDQIRLLRKVARRVAAHAEKMQQEGKGADPAGWWDGDPCPNAGNANKLNVWLPLESRYLLYPGCVSHLLSLRYNAAENRFYNASNSAIAAYPGGDSGTDYSVFNYAGYDEFAAYIAKTFNYTIGRHLFAAPYDWRYNLATMDQVWQMDKLANRIADAVNANCGKKAILIGHSMGTLVSLGLLQNPRFQEWRETNIQGYIAVAPPFGGAVPAINARTSGAGLIDTDGSLTAIVGPVIREILYSASFGLPGPVMLMPYDTAFANNWVVVRTPRRTYTVSQLTELLNDIGDTQAARFFEKVRDLKPLVSLGPVPDVPTYCIYGSGINTPRTYRFRSDIQPNVRSSQPAVAVMGKGDGTVNLESLRLCKQLTTDDRITELTDGTDHSTVLTKASAQAALGTYLSELLTV